MGNTCYRDLDEEDRKISDSGPNGKPRLSSTMMK